MKKFATVSVEVTDKGAITEINGVAPAVVLGIGQIIAQGMELLKNEDRMALRNACAIAANDDAKGLAYIKSEAPEKLIAALRQEGGYGRGC